MSCEIIRIPRRNNKKIIESEFDIEEHSRPLFERTTTTAILCLMNEIDLITLNYLSLRHRHRQTVILQKFLILHFLQQ